MGRPLRKGCDSGARYAAAFNHTAVSNALTIIGMFMPKFGLTPLLGTGALGGALAGAVALPLLTAVVLLPPLLWAVSVARSHDPISWERATEKNRST